MTTTEKIVATDQLLQEAEEKKIIQLDTERNTEFSKDLLPKTGEDKNWGILQFTTLWMGPVHNILSYMTVAGFFILGLNTKQVIAAVMTSAVIVSFFYVINGIASAKYGIPFAMLIRSVFGIKGSIFPSLARGLIAGVVFFGTQSVISAQAFDVIFERLIPGYMTIGGSATILGFPIYSSISFVLVWLVTVGLFIGGTKVLDKLGTYASPVVYVFIIGAAIWSINIAGGFGNVYNFEPENAQFSIPLFIACVSALVSNWAGPIVNIGDFTQKAKNLKAMIIGLPLGFIASYILFAITCVGLIAGTQIAFNRPIFNIVEAIDKMQSTAAVIVLILALNLGATAFVVFGNLFPAGLQLASLFPSKLSVIKGGILTAVIGTLIMPWKLVESQETLFYFYSFIGSMFGPIAGIMLSDFFIAKKQKIELKAIYVTEANENQLAKNYNKPAMWTLGISFAVCMIGAFFQKVELLKLINDFAFFSGLILSFILYTGWTLTKEKE
ncbi:NCS1 nucleoside transporter [Enterococcus phoeniculicola]|jgi:allantoin permease|uniref:NCS1 nucleoside transporter n=1 Tax=Enterococcus phoeniculicola ATCC BAA-412 TaxID=1158610 RepID=R3TU39_9ENTE|nr:cytosine permease [Enterococcus phoeniculicola]EOL44698.1 NCS1 nucleoside transporter [Enterococcus phoeniculicola ATCC BAA-412]EOT74987.1 hypothetical protein I589_02587 [Enterococcus phoeniculicola ATCC BAA-412]OJG72873.1 NCS1 nucleoside transporter [Enterococcus phoeniculicola]